MSGAVFAGEVEGVDGSGRADEEGLGTETGIVAGAGWGGEVEDEIDFACIERLRDVLFEEVKAALVVEVVEVGEVAGAEVVDAANGGAFGEKGAGDARTDESCDACDECGGHSISRDVWAVGLPSLLGYRTKDGMGLERATSNVAWFGVAVTRLAGSHQCLIARFRA